MNNSTVDNIEPTISNKAGGWAGTSSRGHVGTELGAITYGWVRGVGAIPGAFIGGLVGSGIGYFSGSSAGEMIYNQ